MTEEDEVDILGDFSFDSTTQNQDISNVGIEWAIMSEEEDVEVEGNSSFESSTKNQEISGSVVVSITSSQSSDDSPLLIAENKSHTSASTSNKNIVLDKRKNKKARKLHKRKNVNIKKNKTNTRKDVFVNNLTELQLVTGSGQSVKVSSGEEVVKINKLSAESESDVEIDSISDAEQDNLTSKASTSPEMNLSERLNPRLDMPPKRCEPFSKRQRKMRFSGTGGLTIIHTPNGEIYESFDEPQKPKRAKRRNITLNSCRTFSDANPAPYEIRIFVSSLIAMDVHAHTSGAEVMGLLGGRVEHTNQGDVISVDITAYEPAAAAASSTHCDMCPVAQSEAAERLREAGQQLVGWHHSHPYFPALPSHQDLMTQKVMQEALSIPFLSVITSQHWDKGRGASQFRCLKVQYEPNDATDVGYQFPTKLLPDLNLENIDKFLSQLKIQINRMRFEENNIDIAKDVCKDTQITHLQKCLSSVGHHLRACGYDNHDPVFRRTMEGLSNAFR